MLQNYLKTVLLLGILTAVALWIGSFFGTQGLTIALIIVLVMNIGSYFFSDKIVLAILPEMVSSRVVNILIKTKRLHCAIFLFCGHGESN